MSRPAAAVARLGLAMLLGPLAACGHPAGQPDLAPAASEEALVRFTIPEFRRRQPYHATSRDPRTGNEVHYAEFSGADSFAAVVVATAAPGYVLDRRDVRRQIGTVLQGEIDWGDAGSVGSSARSAEYRLFEIPARNARCFGFSRQWGGASGGGLGRHTAESFGFYCRTGQRDLFEDDIQRLIRRISFAGQVIL